MACFHVCLLCIIVMLSLGEVLSRGGVEESGEVFSAKFDIIRAWDSNNCKLFGGYDNSTKCEMDLFDPYDVNLENQKDVRYVMKIQVGSDKKEFKVVVDTGSFQFWVFGVACEDSNLNCVGHTKYDPEESETFEKVDDTFEVKYIVDSVKGMTVLDTVYLAPGLEVTEQAFGAVGWTDKKFRKLDGFLGLDMRKYKGEYTNPFLTAVAAGKVQEAVIGIYIKGGGSAVDGGEITFGGINNAHLKEDTAATAKLITEGFYNHYFTIQMKKLMFGDKEACKEGGDACRAWIDTGCSRITGPKEAIETFTKEVLKANEAHEVTCGDRAGFPDIEISILEEKILILKSADYTYQKRDKCFHMMRVRDLPGGLWTLGDTFLVKYYTKYNMKQAEESITFYETK